MSSGEGPAEESVLVVDFGAQYAQLIARRVREANVYSEIVPHTITAAEVRERQPAAIILSGGPASVHVEGAPSLDREIFDLGVPILGICYGSQLIAQQLGGTVGRNDQGEYGRTTLTSDGPCSLLGSEPPETQTVWMSHFDWITEVPTGVIPTLAADPRYAGVYRCRPHLETAFYRVNVTRPPFDDPALRRALSVSKEAA